MTTTIRPFVAYVLGACALSIAALSLGGCGKSKEQIAVERMSRPGPGKVRVMNMTGGPVELYWKGRIVCPSAPAGEPSRYQPVGSGDQEIVVKANGAEILKVPAKIESKMSQTLIVWGSAGDYRYASVSGEPLRPQATMNLVAYFLDESGKPSDGSVTIGNGKDTYELKSGSEGILVNTGDYTIEGEGLQTAKGASIDAESSYSLFVVTTKEGKKAFLVKNTFIDRPVMAGAAG